jgi:LDH2 family malate/lactate/ureidoglycolate dehydrogenase
VQDWSLGICFGQFTQEIFTRVGVPATIATIDISRFLDPDRYRGHAEDLAEGIKALPKADGVEEILVPGELEDKLEEERRANGIPLPEGTIKRVRVVAERFGVRAPWEE